MNVVDLRMSIARRPWLGLTLLAAALSTGATLGRYWETVAVLLGGLLFLLAWALTTEAQRVALSVMLVSPFLSVFMPIRPDQYNYLAYSAMLVFVVGLVSLLKRPSNLGLTVVYLTWFTVSAVYSTWIIRPTPIYSFLVSPLAMLGMFAIAVCADVSTRRAFIRGLVFMAVLQATLGVAQTLGDLPPFSIWGGRVFSEPRNYLALIVPGVSAQVRMATGTFAHFNGLGSLLALVLPLVLSRWLQRRSFSTAAVLGTVAAGLVCTFSRGALLGGLVGCTIVFTRHEMSLEKATRRTFLALVSLTVATLGFSAVREYVAATGNFDSRFDAWQLALTSVLRDPMRLLFGAGFSFFASGYLQEHAAISRLHSAPVQILTELGLFAAAVLVAALFPPLRRSIRSASVESVMLGASCVAFLTHQAFDNALFGYPGMLFIGVFGCVVAAGADRKDGE